MLYIPWKYEILDPNWCKYHGNMRFCIQHTVNTMEMKDSRSGVGDHTIGGGYGTGDRDHIYMYIYFTYQYIIYIVKYG